MIEENSLRDTIKSIEQALSPLMMEYIRGGEHDNQDLWYKLREIMYAYAHYADEQIHKHVTKTILNGQDHSSTEYNSASQADGR